MSSSSVWFQYLVMHLGCSRVQVLYSEKVIMMNEHVLVSGKGLLTLCASWISGRRIELRNTTLSIVMTENDGDHLMASIQTLLRAQKKGVRGPVPCGPYCFAGEPGVCQVSFVASVTDVDPPQGEYRHEGLPALVLFKGNLSGVYDTLNGLLAIL